MSRFNVIEESYVLKKLDDNKNIQHIKGTNEYTFNYNYQWRNIYNQNQKIGIRSIKLWRAARDICIQNIPIQRDATDTELSEHPDVPIIYKSVFIAGYFKGSTYQDISKLITPPEIKATYNMIKKDLVFSALGDWSFAKEKFNENIIETDDFKVITGGLRFAEGDPEYLNGKVKTMIFHNVWDREDVHVRASFGDLTNEGFLGVSNEQFIPPKEYPVNNNDQKFKIYLYDCTDKPIELPSDGKDTLIVEAMMCSYN